MSNKINKIKTLKSRFNKFLSNNKNSFIKEKDGVFVIEKPWEDETLELIIPLRSKKLSDALNSLYLPPRFSALYHMSQKSLEFIYTAFPIASDYKTRTFCFTYNGSVHQCEFKKSSKELLELVETFHPTGQRSFTDYRNLSDYQKAIFFKEGIKTFKLKDELDGFKFEPISFWINNLDWNENKVIEIARHLNFFMKYFDKNSPQIIIHEDNISTSNYKYQRFLFNRFPSEIVGKPINNNLLVWWGAATDTTNYFLKYIYLYQILEYAAYYYLQNDEENQISNIISSPEIICNKNQTISRILEVLSTRQITDEQKISNVLRKYVDPDILWKEVEPIKEYFTKEISFDGGIRIPALLSQDCNQENFKTQWQVILPWITNLRNYIVHAREKRASMTMTPNRKNRILLHPWINIISLMANQIMIHQ